MSHDLSRDFENMPTTKSRGTNPLTLAERHETEHAFKALKTLREIHFYLWPERYPAKRANKHPDWDGYEDCFQWSAGTIEIVAQMIEDTLADDPATPSAS